MTAFALWLAQSSGGPEFVNLNTIIEAFAGLAILWVLKTVLKNDKKTDAISQAIYGDEHAKEPGGLLHDARGTLARVDRLSDDFREHIRQERVWQDEMTQNITENNNTTHVLFDEMGKRLDEGRRRR